MCVTVNIHPPMSKTRIPASVGSVTFNVHTTHLIDRSVSSTSGAKTPKSDQTKCHVPFSSRKHVGSDMSNMSFHDVMSRHVVMSCHVVTLETDPCVCHCQYSPTHVKDQNPCLCVKGQFQRSPPPPPPPLSKVWLENAQIRPSKVPRPLFIPRACRE